MKNQPPKKRTKKLTGTKKQFVLCIFALVFFGILLSINAEASLLSEEKKYNVLIQGREDTDDLKSLYEALTKTLEDHGALLDLSDAGAIQYRFEQDQKLLIKALEAAGYYKPEVKSDFDEETYTAHFIVDAGTQYQFADIQLIVDSRTSADKKINTPALTSLKAQSGKPALAANVLEDEQEITAWVEKNNCLFEQSTSHEAVVNHLNHTVNINYHVTVGAEVTFGAIAFTGQATIDDSYLEKRTPIEAGECFRRTKLNDAKLALQRSGLLSKVDAVLPETATAGEAVPITFSVLERAHRSVKAGASYSTDIGPGVSAGWEHRNFFSQGEKFSTNLLLATEERRLDAQLEKPYFLRDDQRLKIGAALEQKNSDAYDTTGGSVSAGVERDLGNKWVGGVGTKYGFERIQDVDGTENVALLSFPAFASQDKRNDPLDPTSGWMVKLDSAPSIDTLDRSTRFIKNRASGSYYQSIAMVGKPVVALRAATGSIAGAASDVIPATERFYSGGSGSIRGYGYQLAGPLDSNRDPLGGRSFLELSTELRLRVAEDYGVVAFIDGGNTFDSTYANLENSLLWGAGIGLRYYTSFGPIRADIAVPLNKRAGVDDSFQLYFSIGQAF